MISQHPMAYKIYIHVDIPSYSYENNPLDNEMSVPFRFLSRGDLFHFSCPFFTLK